MEFKVSRVDSISIMKCSVFRGIYLNAISSSLNTVIEHPWPYRKFHSCEEPEGGVGRGPTPPENSQVIWVSIENSIGIAPTQEKAGPPLENGGPHWKNDGPPGKNDGPI